MIKLKKKSIKKMNQGREKQLKQWVSNLTSKQNDLKAQNQPS